MHPLISKTLGGLSTQYYLRQFFFGLIFLSTYIFITLNSDAGAALKISNISFCFINTLLYPYSRFVYESIRNFIMGNNVFLVNALLVFTIKFMTMIMCWGFAIFIAPVGLGYLYYHHSKVRT